MEGEGTQQLTKRAYVLSVKVRGRRGRLRLIQEEFMKRDFRGSGGKNKRKKQEYRGRWWRWQ